MPGHSCSGIILAGGLNTRFAGREKAFLALDGQRILDRLVNLFQNFFEEIIVVTNDPLKYVEWDLHIVTDLFSARSSLTGIHAGLFHATKPFAFCVGCDTPFLEKALVEAVISAVESGVDVVIPETASGLEPLCAVYAKRCLNAIEQSLNHSQLKIQHFFKKVRVKKIEEKKLRNLDPQLLSFFNINTPEDLARAEGLCAGR